MEDVGRLANLCLGVRLGGFPRFILVLPWEHLISLVLRGMVLKKGSIEDWLLGKNSIC